jgi:hypothetical protein
VSTAIDTTQPAVDTRLPSRNGTAAAEWPGMTNSANPDFTAISTVDLSRATGGGNMPLGGNVTQQINTNWGGTQIINPPPRPPTSVVEARRQNPWLGPPPKPMPIRR